MARAVLFALAPVLLAAGCIGTNIGNATKSCAEGERCVCDGIGNCYVDCPGGDCDIRCEGTGNCLVDCPAGGCSIDCEGTGNCIVEECSGDCDIQCTGTGNCVCPEGCGSPRDAGALDAAVDAGDTDGGALDATVDAGGRDAAGDASGPPPDAASTD